MPSLSINSKDLDSLGINLKDLLKAIAQTKSSGDDVIKIKKRKKKVKKVKTKGAIPLAVGGVIGERCSLSNSKFFTFIYQTIIEESLGPTFFMILSFPCL
jgi:hypothetical protein